MARAASTPEAPLPKPACSSKAMDKHLCGFWRWTLHAYCVEIQDLGFRVCATYSVVANQVPPRCSSGSCVGGCRREEHESEEEKPTSLPAADQLAVLRM